MSDEEPRWYHLNIERDGRGWRSRLVSLRGPSTELSAEWSLFPKHGHGFGARLGRNGSDSHLGLDVYLSRVGSAWLRARTPFTKWAAVSKERAPENWYNPRHTGIELFPYRGCIARIQIDRDDNGSSRGQPWWTELKLTTYALMGRAKHTTVEGDSGVARIPLPEGVYLGQWTEKINSRRYGGWRLGRLRDLLRGPLTTRYVDLKVEGGIPIEGKGENSWDCGMDGLFGCGGATLAAAVGHAVEAVLRDRERYGGPHALPRPMTVTEASARG